MTADDAASTTDTTTTQTRRSSRSTVALLVLLAGIIAGLFAGAAWISIDDTQWAKIFTTPLPTLTPLPALANDFTTVINSEVPPAGYYIWRLANMQEWLEMNGSSFRPSLQDAADLLEDHIIWSDREHPSYLPDEDEAVTLLRTEIEDTVIELIDARNFRVCFLIHPDMRQARFLEFGVLLPEGHNIDFPTGTVYVQEAAFESYITLEDFERDCTQPPPPEKR